MVWRFFKLDTIAASLLLATMAAFAFTSAWDDTLTYDEDAHIGAAASYLFKKDMRLNPEHPPLVKDIAALPLLFEKPHLPTDHPSWREEVNGQWNFGYAFLFEADNDPDRIVRLTRIGPMLFMLVLGAVLFWATRELAGVLAGLIALTLYAFSPTVLAHGRLVTTDVPAALGAFLATYLLLRYFAQPNRGRLLAAGLAFGAAQAIKFSLILLVPYFAALAFLWLFVRLLSQKVNVRKEVLTVIGGTILIGIIGYAAIVYPLYAWHVWGYPPERQIHDTAQILANNPLPVLAAIPERIAHITQLRPLAHYMLGLLMATQRVGGGNTTYFLGEVSAEGWWYYFPVVFLIKEPLATLALMFLALAMGLYALRRGLMACLTEKRTSLRAMLAHVGRWVPANQTPHPRGRFGAVQHRASLWCWAHERFAVCAMVLWIVLYVGVSIGGNLNIGVRHLLPVFPFLFALTGIAAWRWLALERHVSVSWLRTILDNMRALLATGLKGVVVAALLAILAATTLLQRPHFLQYFNELAGGPQGGHRYAVDSNLDWGQDLRRLDEFVRAQKIEKISVDYFGWAPPERYLASATVERWWAERGQPSGWFAVSATFRQGNCASPGPNFHEPTGRYCFLEQFDPVAVIGHSIFVYHLP